MVRSRLVYAPGVVKLCNQLFFDTGTGASVMYRCHGLRVRALTWNLRGGGHYPHDWKQQEQTSNESAERTGRHERPPQKFCCGALAVAKERGTISKVQLSSQVHPSFFHDRPTLRSPNGGYRVLQRTAETSAVDRAERAEHARHSVSSARSR